MKNFLIILIVAMIALLPSCESNEEKMIRQTKEDYIDIAEDLLDLFKGTDISDADFDAMKADVDEFKKTLKNTSDMSVIKEETIDLVDNFVFTAYFYVDMDTIDEYLTENQGTHPEIFGAPQEEEPQYSTVSIMATAK